MDRGLGARVKRPLEHRVPQLHQSPQFDLPQIGPVKVNLIKVNTVQIETGQVYLFKITVTGAITLDQVSYIHGSVSS